MLPSVHSLPCRLLLLLLIVFLPALIHAQTPSTQIRLNQVGFYPDAPKQAVIVDAPAGDFTVTTSDGSATVFTGTLGNARTWAPSQETVRVADFSGLATPGTYVLVVPGIGTSYPFRVASYVHQDVAKASIKGFYYQRASTALDAKYAGRWARSAGHPDNRVYVHASAATTSRPTGTIISAPRGWYDAGDYNKYIVNSGITMGTLLMLYEHFPAYFGTLPLNIPESGNAIPDLLDEVLWNLRWMLAMQDPDDGGVYHKLTNANFDGMVMPNQATATRYVVQKGTAAALDFAAVTAIAARVYRNFETSLPGLADSCLTASQAAWNWALQHPNVRYDQSALNQAYNPDINTGEYGDSGFQDEFRWAATELFLTTGNAGTVVQYNPLSESTTLPIPGWPGVGTMAFYSLAHHRSAVGKTVDTTEVKRRIISRADQLLADRTTSAYDIVMGRSTGEFYWGSNSLAANQGMLLIQAYRLTRDARYLQGALSNLDYLLGRNATGYSFVTGYGDKVPMRPHHRPSEADGIGDPVPGLLVGGPNPGREDQSGCPAYPSTLAAKAYLDNVCSYASNEIAINWNAPLAYLAGAVEALYSATGLPTAIETPVAGLPVSEPAVEAYPNPARTRLTLAIDLPASGAVTLTLYDILGRKVATVLQQSYAAAGRQLIPLEVQGLAGGTYLVRLESAGVVVTRRFLVVR